MSRLFRAGGLQRGQIQPLSVGVYSPEQFDTQAEAEIVPFLACGDLSGFDSDRSYPLVLDEKESFVYHEPVQKPIHPPYFEYMEMKKSRVKENCVLC